MIYPKILKANETGWGTLIEYDAGYISTDIENNKKIFEEINRGEEFIIKEPLILYAVLQKYDVLNNNGRIYPKSVLIKAVDDYQKFIRQNSAIGECEHPDNPIINSKEVSHRILETWWENKTLMGKIEIILSPGYISNGIISCRGDLVANLLRKNILIGVSSRGVGSVEKNSKKELIVQDDFELISWDIVMSPSTPGAWISKNQDNLKQFVEQKNNKKSTIIEICNNFLEKK